MLKAILFDLDNTLIDFMKMKLACSRSAVDAMVSAGLKMSSEAAFKKLMSVYWEIGIENERIFQEFLRRIGKKIDYKILASGIIAYRRMQFGLIKPYAGVVPVLINLKKKGLKLAIVTDAPRLKAWIRLTELGLQDFFDEVVAFEDTNMKKPSSLPFSKALKNLRVKADETLMIGDSPERDIIGAQRLGMHTCFAQYGQQTKIKNAGAEFTISRFEEINRIVEKMM